MEARLSTLATLTLRALLPLGEPSPRKFRRPLTSPVACRHPQPVPSGESSSHAPLSRSRPTTPVDLATTDSSDGLPAPRLAPRCRGPCEPRPTLRFRRLSDAVSGDHLHGQSRSFTTPVKG